MTSKTNVVTPYCSQILLKMNKNTKIFTYVGKEVITKKKKQKKERSADSSFF